MRVDDNGNFWVTDRLKEVFHSSVSLSENFKKCKLYILTRPPLSQQLIKYKGFQVPPSELEDLLLQHPLVADAAVTSIYSDEQATELPIAYVTLTSKFYNNSSSSSSSSSSSQAQKQQALDEIRAWCDGQVAGYKKLRGGVWELQNLPKTPSGKILRKDLPCRRQEAKQAKL